MLSKRSKKQLDVVRFSYVPDRISKADLRDGIFFYTADERQKLLTFLKQNYADKNVRLSKKELAKYGLPSQYSVVVYDQQYYVLYLGRVHERHAGAGSFGVVKYLQNLETGSFNQVVKIFSEWHTPPSEYQTKRTEIGVLRSFLNEEYAHLHAIGDASASEPILRQSRGKGEQLLKPQSTKEGVSFDVFMENYLSLRGGKITDPQYILGILMNMCRAVIDVHEVKKLLHRDIKRQNFMVNPRTAQVELVDFGFAVPIDKVFDKTSNKVGTPGCVAPEIVNEEIPEYSKKSEAFALGATIASAFDLDICNSGGFLFQSDGSVDFIPLALKPKSSVIQNDALMSVIYELCRCLLQVDPVNRIDVPTTLQMLSKAYSACRNVVPMLAFNLADYVGVEDKCEAIDFLANCKRREIMLFINEDDRNNPALCKAAIAFTRMAQKQGYIVHADVLVIPAKTKHADIQQLVADHVAQTIPQIKYDCMVERFVSKRDEKYHYALAHVIDKIPDRSIRKKYATKFAELNECGAPLWKVIAELKLLASDKRKKAARNNSGFFAKRDAVTEQVIAAINSVDLKLSFNKSQLAVMLLQLAPNAMQAKIY